MGILDVERGMAYNYPRLQSLVLSLFEDLGTDEGKSYLNRLSGAPEMENLAKGFDIVVDRVTYRIFVVTSLSKVYISYYYLLLVTGILKTLSVISHG